MLVFGIYSRPCGVLIIYTYGTGTEIVGMSAVEILRVLVGPDHLLLVFLAAFNKRLSSAVESNVHGGISRTLIQKLAV
jgi:hypothetical protein